MMWSESKYLQTSTIIFPRNLLLPIGSIVWSLQVTVKAPFLANCVVVPEFGMSISGFPLDGQKRTFKLSAVGRGGQDVAIIGHLRVCK